MKKLDVHFTGLYALVPNTWTGGPPATSWSMLLVNLEDRFDLADRAIEPHSAVLRYELDQFDASHDPHLIIPGTPGQGVFRLQGHRIEFDLPQTTPQSFRPNDIKLTKLDKVKSGEKTSALWIPKIDCFLTGAGTLAPESKLGLFHLGGFPLPAKLGAHVLLRRGTLDTSAHAPLAFPNVANIWDFKDEQGSAVPPRAVAARSTLRSGALRDWASITIRPGAGTAIVLKQKKDMAQATISNSELESVVGWVPVTNNINYGEIDSEFDLMYWFSQSDGKKERLLPHFLKQVGKGGAGSLRRTCGGARFKMFDVSYRDIIEKWK